MLQGRLLHVGCTDSPIPHFLEFEGEEVRLDIDPQWNPDIVADMTDMGDIGEYDLVLACHVLEHVYPHEVEQTLKEFRRVLKSGGAAIVFVPDLEDVKPDRRRLYDVPGGFVCGLDLFYGHAGMVKGNPLMAHKTGFTRALLMDEFREAGFNDITGRRCQDYNLMVGGKK